jgi:hypothetical protein
MPRIALIHATRLSIDPIAAAFAQHWPEAQLEPDVQGLHRSSGVETQPARSSCEVIPTQEKSRCPR